MTATAAERRAARTEARREEILDAAQRIFAHRGYSDTGIADIAADLGIGHGTFYRYFENKQDVAVQVLDRAVLEIGAALADEDPHETNDVDEYRAQTMRIMLRMFEMLDQRPEAFELLHMQSVAIDTDATQRSFEAYSAYTEVFLRNGVEKGFLRQDIDIEITAQALVGLIFEGTRRAIAEDAPRDLWTRWINAGVALMFEGVSRRL
ncbi:MAG: TetR/AcrR family transcriptional regulator [Solirubrobacterales bacterium]